MKVWAAITERGGAYTDLCIAGNVVLKSPKTLLTAHRTGEAGLCQTLVVV